MYWRVPEPGQQFVRAHALRSGPICVATLILACAVGLFTASGLFAQPPAPLTTLASITSLNNSQASNHLPVNFEATVGVSRGYEHILFVQDGDRAIFVRPPSKQMYQPGDRLRIRGKTQNSFTPIVIADTLTLLGHGPRPVPVQATYWDLVKADLDCRTVMVRGRVRSADLNGPQDGKVRNARLRMIIEGGQFQIDIESADKAVLKKFIDAEVEATGVAAGLFDGKMQQTGAVVYVASPDDIHILKPAAQSPDALPITPIDRILEAHSVTDNSRRVHVHGTITYYQPGAVVVLQDGSMSIWIDTHMHDELTIGNHAEATGFPAERDRTLILTDGAVEDTHVLGYVKPFVAADWQQLALWSLNKPTGHQNDLVSIEGRIVTEVREPLQDQYVLNSDGRLFSAVLRHPSGSEPAPMLRFPTGALLRVTGICTIPDLSAIVPGGDVPFQVMLRTRDDLVRTGNPPLFSPRNMIVLAAILLAACLLAIFWGWHLERTLRRQSGAMTRLEQRRSAILESINSSRPLAAILEQIAALISSTLQDAPCWIEVSDGATTPAPPADIAQNRIATRPITSQNGTIMGAIHAVPHTAPSDPAVTRALEIGGRVALLAIETRRLYADLTYRSEFDALTDVHNRFSLDRFLDEQVKSARRNALVFGLIYVDLDDFKLVNDLYGHHAGDLLLKEVSLRMKRQLRPGDILARLGGDEFAVLVPNVRSRHIVEEIAGRLGSCFGAPFSIEGRMLHGSASIGIALYPEDGATSDALLKAADSAMYEEKKNRKPAVSA